MLPCAPSPLPATWVPGSRGQERTAKEDTPGVISSEPSSKWFPVEPNQATLTLGNLRTHQSQLSYLPQISTLLWGLSSKETACNAGDLGLIPGSGRSPEEGNDSPLLPGESHGQRSLARYNLVVKLCLFPWL